MMKIEIVPYEPDHGYKIMKENISKHSDLNKLSEGCKTAGPSYTMFIDGEIVMCAGVALLGFRKGEAWLLPSVLFYKHIKTCFKTVKDYLNKIVKEHDLRRVQSLVNPKSEYGCRWMRHLGFKRETEDALHSYGPNGEDMVMFGRVYK